MNKHFWILSERANSGHLQTLTAEIKNEQYFQLSS